MAGWLRGIDELGISRFEQIGNDSESGGIRSPEVRVSETPFQLHKRLGQTTLDAICERLIWIKPDSEEHIAEIESLTIQKNKIVKNPPFSRGLVVKRDAG